MLKRTVENIQKISYKLTSEDVKQAIIDYTNNQSYILKSGLVVCCIAGDNSIVILNANGGAIVTNDYIDYKG